MPQKILLFGTGFIATNLIEHFDGSNIEIIVLYNKHKIKNTLNVKQYPMDSDIKSLLKEYQPNQIIILHGESFVAHNTNIEVSIHNNVLKVSNFLETIYAIRKDLKLEKILVIGSASEYGKFYNEPIKDSFELHPTSIYGLSKIFLFNLARFFLERGLPIIYVRQFNTIGVGQRENFVFPSFCKEILLIENDKKEPVLNVGDLSQERDFIDVRDTCRAYETLLQKGVVGETYNVASGKFIDVGTLLQNIIQHSLAANKKIKIVENKNLFSKEESLSKRLHADISKLNSLGFTPKYSLQETIEHMLNHGRENV